VYGSNAARAGVALVDERTSSAGLAGSMATANGAQPKAAAPRHVASRRPFTAQPYHVYREGSARGSVRRPVTALAAATAGDTR